MNNRTVAVDFDGVLSSHDGWKGPTTLGTPVPGAREFLQYLKNEGFRVVIHSARLSAEHDLSDRNRGYDAISRWLNAHSMPYHRIWVQPGKPIAIAYVDDRAVICCPQKDGESAWRHARVRVAELARETV